MNSFLQTMKSNTNYTLTENGAITHKTTGSKVYDMFAEGGAYRNRTKEDKITLFSQAFKEDYQLALKCLFYLRDVRGGQGEREFFRTCFHWLCNEYPEVADRNMIHVSEYGRWDDLIYAVYGTKLHYNMIEIIKAQLKLDLDSKTPSLLAKWMPSENTSSRTTRMVAAELRKNLSMTSKQYRKALSKLRARIKVVEGLMSANRWEEIEFDKIPSRAGIIYRNAFARRDLIAKKYENFAKSKDTKVNASALYPYDIAHRAMSYEMRSVPYEDTKRVMLQKYWENLPDYYNGKQENGIAVVDVSGSMGGQPMEVAISLGAYIAERGHGPFANHFITFSESPDLVEFTGVDITDKIRRAEKADWGYNTDIEAVFELLLNTAKSQKTRREDMPERLYILSDMEFDKGMNHRGANQNQINTLLEVIAQEWKREGYELPQLIFWNLDARQDNIPMLKGGRFAYLSGFSPVMLKQILSGKDGYDLMIAKLVDSGRYDVIH